MLEHQRNLVLHAKENAAKIDPVPLLFFEVSVGSPSYFAKRKRPQTPQDLTGHDCISLRLPTYGGLYAWEFEKGGRELKVRVEGQLVFNNIALRLHASLAGFDLAYLPED